MTSQRPDSETALVLELRRSLARLELALAQISDGLVITDASGLLLWCNARFEQMLKQPRLLLLTGRLDHLLNANLALQTALDFSQLLLLQPQGGMVTLFLDDALIQVMEMEWRPVQL